MHRIRLRLLILLFIGLPAVAFSQIRQFAPGRKAVEKDVAMANARRHATDTLDLPFWDDFSAPKGHNADSLLWVVNDKVFVNNGQAINPPSINVATFDGYNELGLPYSTDPLETGAGDTLESQPIRLRDIAAQYRDKIYLSFTYQAGGNSEMPNPDDYLKLEFNSVKGWIEMRQFRVSPNTEHDKFYDVVVQVTPPDPLDPNDTIFFHNNFRFRFISLGRISGQYDAWHLDYVYLNRRVQDDEELPPDVDPPTDNIIEYDINTNISDRTTTRPFTSILPDGYFSIPYSHFNPNDLITPRVSLYSLKHVTFDFQFVTYASRYTITLYNDGTSSVPYNQSPDPDDETDFIPSDGIPPLQHITVDTQNLPPASTFDPAADSATVKVVITIDGGDNNEDLDFYERYGDINFELNDRLEHTFTLSSYYAYDDGVAEYSAGLAAQGNQLAYRFLMDESLGPKALNGIYMYLPFTGSTAPENIRVYVFPDDNGKPDSLHLYSQLETIRRTANNEFIFIPFTEEVTVRGNFYIGYLETVTDRPDRIRVGLDTSHDTGEHLYYRNTIYHQWVQNDEVQGSFMMRPSFGAIDPVTGVENPRSPVTVYPNPNRGEFYVEGAANTIQIITLTGQSVSFTAEELPERKKITLHTTTPGIYIIRYRSGSNVYADKILIK